MRTLAHLELQHPDSGESVEITIRLQARWPRKPIYHVTVVNDTRRDWDVKVQYIHGPELRWALAAPWRTETPEPAKLTLEAFKRDVWEYRRMGYEPVTI